jgi:cyclase
MLRKPRRGTDNQETPGPYRASIAHRHYNERSVGRPIDLFINTHHHGDHTAGNGVFKPVTKRMLAHVNVPKLQLEAAAKAAQLDAASQPVPVVATETYEKTWREPINGEMVALKHYGPAHTSGDSVITFERANVVHMGDLVFNRRHPYIDKPAGASIANWMATLDAVTKDHDKDTLFIFGHAGPSFPVTGGTAELRFMRDYLAALLEFVRGEMKAGKPRLTHLMRRARRIRGTSTRAAETCVPSVCRLMIEATSSRMKPAVMSR